MDTAKVLEGSSADLEHLSPLIKALGSEAKILESHEAGAVAVKPSASPTRLQTCIPSGS